ncbi:IQ domain-containing protein IQM2-like [Olea europaea var. sylvestris]|uniref:IQ domain-containing protein IQM2-like n=1 Tax=Olea europaea var. sylvestris TaxID=158386 RepID=UPI000C1D7254|nr:IQ domain-containing protein IQM2-like [Olea europaea var. sylvestris]
MGVYCSCPVGVYSDLESGFESVIFKSINLGDDNDRKTPVRSVEPTVVMLTEGSFSFRTRENEMTSTEAPVKDKCACQEMISTVSTEGIPQLTGLNLSSPKHEAAVKLQKVYKSFRTRRKLADCAVLVEKSWWKLLDFAQLKHSSISFFDLEKHETAVSRWSRARTRAAKVGKGLSKNSKAQKLALQHWLEAIDPRHRYGHNLHFYYVKWLNSQSMEPFFYWLDIGEGKEVNLVEKCSRSKLQQQCIKYLGPMERKAYEVVVEDGKLCYKQTGELLDTTIEPKGAKWIFVLSTSRKLYVGKKKKGTFQHSSFLAGGATLAAGRIVVENGILKAVWPHSGHYRPTPENFQDFISFLRENNVDLADVKLDSIDDEEEESVGKKGGLFLRCNSSEEGLAEKDRLETVKNNTEDSILHKVLSREGEGEEEEEEEITKSKTSHDFSKKLTTLEIPSKADLLETLKIENKVVESKSQNFLLESPMGGYETAEESFASETRSVNQEHDSSDQEHEEIISEESILQRINSHKDMKSFQLGNKLSCKWSTGAGPRIGCLRDYPSKLQYHALEQVNLSPRTKRRLRLDSPSRESTPTSFGRETPTCSSSSPLEKSNLSHNSSHHSITQSSLSVKELTKSSC